MKFLRHLNDGQFVTIVLGNGIPALSGRIGPRYVDWFEFRTETDDGRITTYHIPYESVVYVRLVG